jgi:predicted Zn-dependent protease
MNARIIVLAVIGVLSAGSAILLLLGDTDYEVGLDSAVEIWADVARDADFIGLRVTRVTAEREMEIGREIEQDVLRWFRVDADQALQDYVEQVGQALAPHAVRGGIEYRFHVIDADYVNAFAIPGGGVFITSGMLEFLETEAELAAILGHEISHIDLRHSIERLQYELFARRIVGNLAGIIRMAHELVGVGYSEQQELEADRRGALISANAGYDILGAVDVLARLATMGIEEYGSREAERPTLVTGEVLGALWDALGDYFASHPATPQRGRELAGLVTRNTGDTLGRDLYVGRSNHADRVPRAQDDRADERIRYSEVPEIVDCELAAGVTVPVRAGGCSPAGVE